MKHTVTPVSTRVFHVTSARSGRVYEVRPTGGDSATCQCKAYEYRKACSHVAAVREFAARALGVAIVTMLDKMGQSTPSARGSRDSAVTPVRGGITFLEALLLGRERVTPVACIVAVAISVTKASGIHMGASTHFHDHVATTPTRASFMITRVAAPRGRARGRSRP